MWVAEVRMVCFTHSLATFPVVLLYRIQGKPSSSILKCEVRIAMLILAQFKVKEFFNFQFYFRMENTRTINRGRAHFTYRCSFGLRAMNTKLDIAYSWTGPSKRQKPRWRSQYASYKIIFIIEYDPWLYFLESRWLGIEFKNVSSLHYQYR